MDDFTIEDWEREEAELAELDAAAERDAARAAQEAKERAVDAVRAEEAKQYTPVVNGLVTAPWTPPTFVLKAGTATADGAPSRKKKLAFGSGDAGTSLSSSSTSTSSSPDAINPRFALPFTITPTMQRLAALEWILLCTNFMSTFPTREQRGIVEEVLRVQCELPMSAYARLKKALKESEPERKAKPVHLRPRRKLPSYFATLNYRLDRVSDVPPSTFDGGGAAYCVWLERQLTVVLLGVLWHIHNYANVGKHGHAAVDKSHVDVTTDMSFRWRIRALVFSQNPLTSLGGGGSKKSRRASAKPDKSSKSGGKDDHDDPMTQYRAGREVIVCTSAQLAEQLRWLFTTTYAQMTDGLQRPPSPPQSSSAKKSSRSHRLLSDSDSDGSDSDDMGTSSRRRRTQRTKKGRKVDPAGGGGGGGGGGARIDRLGTASNLELIQVCVDEITRNIRDIYDVAASAAATGSGSGGDGVGHKSGAPGSPSSSSRKSVVVADGGVGGSGDKAGGGGAHHEALLASLLFYPPQLAAVLYEELVRCTYYVRPVYSDSDSDSDEDGDGDDIGDGDGKRGGRRGNGAANGKKGGIKDSFRLSMSDMDMNMTTDTTMGGDGGHDVSVDPDDSFLNQLMAQSDDSDSNSDSNFLKPRSERKKKQQQQQQQQSGGQTARDLQTPGHRRDSAARGAGESRVRMRTTARKGRDSVAAAATAATTAKKPAGVDSCLHTTYAGLLAVLLTAQHTHIQRSAGPRHTLHAPSPLLHHCCFLRVLMDLIADQERLYDCSGIGADAYLLETANGVLDDVDVDALLRAQQQQQQQHQRFGVGGADGGGGNVSKQQQRTQRQQALQRKKKKKQLQKKRQQKKKNQRHGVGVDDEDDSSTDASDSFGEHDDDVLDDIGGGDSVAHDVNGHGAGGVDGMSGAAAIVNDVSDPGVAYVRAVVAWAVAQVHAWLLDYHLYDSTHVIVAFKFHRRLLRLQTRLAEPSTDGGYSTVGMSIADVIAQQRADQARNERIDMFLVSSCQHQFNQMKFEIYETYGGTPRAPYSPQQLAEFRWDDMGEELRATIDDDVRIHKLIVEDTDPLGVLHTCPAKVSLMVLAVRFAEEVESFFARTHALHPISDARRTTAYLDCISEMTKTQVHFLKHTDIVGRGDAGVGTLLFGEQLPDLDQLYAKPLDVFIQQQRDKCFAVVARSIEVDEWVAIGGSPFTYYSTSVVDVFSFLHTLRDLFFSYIGRMLPYGRRHLLVFSDVVNELMRHYCSGVASTCGSGAAHIPAPIVSRAAPTSAKARVFGFFSKRRKSKSGGDAATSAAAAAAAAAVATTAGEAAGEAALASGGDGTGADGQPLSQAPLSGDDVAHHSLQSLAVRLACIVGAQQKAKTLNEEIHARTERIVAAASRNAPHLLLLTNDADRNTQHTRDYNTPLALHAQVVIQLIATRVVYVELRAALTHSLYLPDDGAGVAMLRVSDERTGGGGGGGSGLGLGGGGRRRRGKKGGRRGSNGGGVGADGVGSGGSSSEHGVGGGSGNGDGTTQHGSLLDAIDDAMGELHEHVPDATFPAVARCVFKTLMEAYAWVLQHRATLHDRAGARTSRAAHAMYAEDVAALQDMFKDSLAADDVQALSMSATLTMDDLCNRLTWGGGARS